MHHFHMGQMAEYNRRRIEEDIKQIQLEKLAREAHQPRINQLRPILLRLADWLITMGRRLHKEFDPPQKELKLRRTV